MKTRRLFAILISMMFVTLPLVADAGVDAAAIYKSKCAIDGLIYGCLIGGVFDWLRP